VAAGGLCPSPGRGEGPAAAGAPSHSRAGVLITQFIRNMDVYPLRFLCVVPAVEASLSLLGDGLHFLADGIAVDAVFAHDVLLLILFSIFSSVQKGAKMPASLLGWRAFLCSFVILAQTIPVKNQFSK